MIKVTNKILLVSQWQEFHLKTTLRRPQCQQQINTLVDFAWSIDTTFYNLWRVHIRCDCGIIRCEVRTFIASDRMKAMWDSILYWTCREEWLKGGNWCCRSWLIRILGSRWGSSQPQVFGGLDLRLLWDADQRYWGFKDRTFKGR